MMSRKSIWVLLLAAAVVSVPAGSALAALAGSAHDILAWNPAIPAKKGPCSFCHVPHKATGNKLFPNAINVTGLSGVWSTDNVAQICWSCHGSTQTVGNRVRNVMPFQDTSHKRLVAALVAMGDVADLNNVYGISGGNMSCVSCHSAHSNDKRPFLRDRTGMTPYTEGDFQTFCTQCHVNRAQNAGTGTFTNHPTGVDLTPATSVSIKTYANVDPVFKNTYGFSQTGAFWTLTKSATDGTESWNLGGKFKFAASPTDFNCATCHAVHANETATFSANDGYLANGYTTVVTPPGNDLCVLASDPAQGAVTAICAGCHDIAAGRGPGLTGTFSHPYVTAVTATGNWSTPVNTTAMIDNGAKIGGDLPAGVGDTLDCQSCHDMHFARLPRVSGSSGLDGKYALMRLTCQECHTTAGFANHHPIGPVKLEVLGGTGGTGTQATVDVDATDNVRIATTMTWANIPYNDTGRAAVIAEARGTVRTAISPGAGYSFGTLSGSVGTMTCATCHAGGKAHNNTSAFPALVGDITNDGMCIDCHGTNPSNNAKNLALKTTRTGTHFVGAIDNTNNKWGAGTSQGSVTPTTTMTPVYGTGPANGAIICRSCHTLKTKSAGVYRTVWASSSNASDSEETTRDSVGLLLSPSGNSRDDTSTTNDYLCSACHGASPGSGSTHPTKPTVTSFTSTTATTNANTSNNYVTTESAATNAINCESCHRPHNADTDGSTKVLENAAIIAGSPPYMDQSVLCNDCHVK